MLHFFRIAILLSLSVTNLFMIFYISTIHTDIPYVDLSQHYLTANVAPGRVCDHTDTFSIGFLLLFPLIVGGGVWAFK